MSFTFNSRYVLLTYSQSAGLSEWSVLDKISSLGGECIIGREDHEDGGTHLHVFIDFGRKFRSRKADVFDVGEWHPNVSPSKGTPEKGYDYAIKDGDVVAGGLARPDRAVSTGSTHSKWTEIASAGSREEVWSLLEELDPKSMLCNFTQISKWCDWKFTIRPEEYVSPLGVQFIGGDLDGRDQWLSQSGIGDRESPLGK